ncbi:flavodoxin family protein [Staphylococcus massiliensis]|uniref:FMN-dependent NADPH-azoreductase n=1 Tax=Staphylococcus massiliensis S46 TaxID=1229783 RepID=K9AV09_9STAP|nr:flavodoxin family protein [Staphylococcus massiliensis]EKU45305.1 NADPH-dependent FMN reductase [Staphylococcus massiliensis S46]
MKKVTTIVESRQIHGRPMQIAENLKEKFESFELLTIDNKILTPLNCNILPSTGCKNCFINGFCPTEKVDQVHYLKQEILESDILIVISPVYSHNVSGDIKNIIDRISYWAHLFRLAAKPIIVIATAESNGTNFVLNYLNKVFTAMGGIIISQKSFLPTEQDKYINNIESISETVRSTLSKRILFVPNETQEYLFLTYKRIISTYSTQNFEYQYWEKEGLFYFETLKDYYKSIQ